MNIEEHVPLSSLTTMKTGGNARYVAFVDIEGEIDDVVAFAKRKGLPIIPLGGGSNIVASDNGIEAVFLKMSDEFTLERLEEYDGMVEVTAFAGFSWDSFVETAVSKGWWGIENLSGIPGTVGAAAVQNIGAYGAALSETLIRVTAYDLKDGTFKTLKKFTNEECQFKYRTSIFKQERDRYFISRIRFRLSTEPRPRISYKDVAAHFSMSGNEPTLSNIRRAVIGIREGKFPPLSEYGTSGSFFLNPVVSADEAKALSSHYTDMPLFEMPEGGVKIPLAWILDKILHLKGYRFGKAFLWDKQPIVIAAESGATSRDVLALAEHVRGIVRDTIGVEIEFEVRTEF